MFSYSFLENIVDKVYNSKDNFLEGLDSEKNNSGNNSRMVEFKAGSYEEDIQNSVYFHELHDIKGDPREGEDKLKSFNFKTTTINSRLEFRFINSDSYNKYNEYLQNKEEYLSKLNNLDKQIDKLNEEISQHKSDQRRIGREPNKYLINSKKREIAVKNQNKEQERVLFQKKKKNVAHLIDPTYCKEIGDENNEKCKDFKPESFKTPYFKIIGEEMTLDVDGVTYTSRDQKNYIIRQSTSTEIMENGNNGFSLINRWKYYGEKGKSGGTNNIGITTIPITVVGELVLKFVNKSYVDALDQIEDEKRYSFKKSEMNDLDNRELQLKSGNTEDYVIIVLPIFKTLKSNSNGIEVRKIIDNLFTGQQMSESTANISTALVDFSKFIPYEQPYYYYESTDTESEYGNGNKKSTNILFLNSSLHIVDPSFSNIMPVKKNVNNVKTSNDVKINEKGLKNLDLENNDLDCNEIGKKGEVIHERIKQATASSKIMNFTEQIEELQKNFYGQVLLGIIFCLIAYSIYFMFIKISFLAGSKSGLGKDVAGQSKRFMIPKNTAFDVMT